MSRRRKLRDDDQAAISQIESSLLEALPKHGFETHKATARRVAELRHLANKVRRQMLTGAAVNLEDVIKLEAMATEAAKELPPPNVISKLEIELVPSRYEIADAAELKAENERLKALLSDPNRQAVTASSDTDTAVAQPSASPDAPAAKPANNVVSLPPPTDEQRRQRAQAQREAALRNAPVVSQPGTERYAAIIASPDNPTGRSPYERFDYPKSGNW